MKKQPNISCSGLGNSQSNQRKSSVVRKVAILGPLLFALVALLPGRAVAANLTCTVTSVTWQKYSSTVPTDLLMVGCSDGNGYAAYVGTSSQVTTNGCYATADAVKAFESMAVSARLAGKPLSIWWTSRSCPGNAGQRSLDSLTLM